MVFPSSQISKALLAFFVALLIFYVYMDVNLYFRIRNYAIDITLDNSSRKYEDVAWIDCDINPLCTVTVKGVLLDHTNLYLFSPLVTMVDDLLSISSKLDYITPNAISVFHVFVALLSAKCISSDSLAYRRVGVVLFEFRTLLDDLDGHVARARKHIKGEHSEIGSSGYFVDGLCDAIGCTFLMLGVFSFLRSNPPRRGYMQLPTNDKEANVVYKTKVSSNTVPTKVLCFSSQLLISSMAWNRYIALYQNLLEGSYVETPSIFPKQNIVFKSTTFFAVAFLWRIVNVHNLLDCLLLSIFCDKLWEFLRCLQYAGFFVLLFVICITEIHFSDIKKFILQDVVPHT